ncbi:DUF3572 domain-containing protein [Tropicimonas sp.]|uniref:DUF3572 domain-containing protein n=1 Tax=Tropicimonas sp. TaxID=2067044 RepID=UPI003A872768
MQRENAETLAIRALAWLVGNDELLPLFLGSTGATAADLRTRADDPEFLGSVLEFLTMDDAWIAAFCEAERIDYALPLAARVALGDVAPDWT